MVATAIANVKATWGLLFTSIPGRHVQLTKDRRAVLVLERRMYFWWWELKHLLKTSWFEPIYLHRQNIDMRVAPITANPKVRDVIYQVVVAPIVTIEGVQQLVDQKLMDKQARDAFVRSLLYDFNNDHSTQIGELYNPCRAEQQDAFYQLVRGFLEPHLSPTGLKIVDASFSCRDDNGTCGGLCFLRMSDFCTYVQKSDIS